MKTIRWGRLLLCVLAIVAIGFLSGIATAEGVQGWYKTLIKPSFNPPGYLFGPVWTFLYILMGISLYIITEAPATKARTNAFIIFGVQLFLNFCWSFLFFYFHLKGIALIEIICLWIALILMIVRFRKISHFAAYIQVPYLLWVSFASVLNGALWYLNQ